MILMTFSEFVPRKLLRNSLRIYRTRKINGLYIVRWLLLFGPLCVKYATPIKHVFVLEGFLKFQFPDESVLFLSNGGGIEEVK